MTRSAILCSFRLKTVLTVAVSTCWLAATAHAEVAPTEAARVVDRLLNKELFDGQSPDVPLVDDEMYLRRVTLDIIGDLPTPGAVTAFTLDPASGKRDAAVQRLLESEHYGQNWARYWRDVILYRRAEDRALIVANPLTIYLTEALNENRSWDSIARDFITAKGDIREDGRTAIIAAQEGKTEETTAEMSRILLGIQIQCAQCHDHMTDRWKREQFHELAAFFPRIALRPVNDGLRRTLMVVAQDAAPRRPKGDDGRRAAAEHFMPDLENPSADGSIMSPKFFLTGMSVDLGTPDADRRGRLADAIAENPWFAKAVVNRLWAEMVGEGFYEPIDDLGPDKTPSAPATIEYLSEQFVASGYDLKWLFRTIAASEAYQRESRARRNANQKAFTANCPQRLRADQLYNALTQALAVEELADRGPGAGRRGYLPGGPRTAFNDTFGFDPSLPRDEVKGSIPQALAMMNAPQLNRLIEADRSSMLGRLLESTKDNELVVIELYLRCLAREPRDRELQTSLSYVEEVGDRKEAFEDLLWALINSTEFLHRR